MKISFIGAGSMAEAIISGLIQNKIFEPKQIFVTNHQNRERLCNLEEQYGINGTYDVEKLYNNTNIVILAMKPKDAKTAFETMKQYVNEDTLIISVLAGIPLSFMNKHLVASQPIIRAMPNTSAAVNKSATALSKNAHVTTSQHQLAVDLFSTIGITVTVEENQLDAITGLSGSGPAYYYYIVEAMEKVAEQLGVEKEIALPLIYQTIEGAAHMLSQSKHDAKELKNQVTSPGGTTEAGLQKMADHQLESAIIEGVKAATEKSKQLSKMFMNE